MARGRGSSLVVVTNHRAGGMSQLGQGLAVLRRGAPGLVVVDTSDPHFEEALRGAAGRTVVAAGGDGTLHVLAEQLWRLGLLADAVLGLLPLGTGNDLARTVGIPLDPRRAADVVLSGHARSLDLLVDGTGAVAVNAVHCGVGGLAVRHAAPLKPWLGRLAYRLGAAWAGARAPGWSGRVQLDGAPLFEGELLFVGVGNGRTIGGGSVVWPHARPDDGLVDVVVAVAGGRMSRLDVIRGLRSGNPEETRGLVTGRGRAVRVDTPAIPCVADGEDCGTRVGPTWSVYPAAWRLLVPQLTG